MVRWTCVDVGCGQLHTQPQALAGQWRESEVKVCGMVGQRRVEGASVQPLRLEACLLSLARGARALHRERL